MTASGGEFDIAIVGAGSAGCVLAHRLAAAGIGTIALIEAGGQDRSPWFRVPIGFYKTRGNPAFDWCFRTEPEQATGGRTIDWPRGRVIGGSSSINGMLYVRGHRIDYDGWEASGISGWSWSEVEPYFRRAEAWQGVDDREYGRSGPLPVSAARFDTPLSDLVMRAGRAHGLPQNRQYNNGDNTGLVKFDVTMDRGQRSSSARAYLTSTGTKNIVKLFSNRTVSKIAINQRRANGVVVVGPDGQNCEITARRGVVLCAGTIGSPHLLHHSGIGPPDLMQKAGLTVLHPSPLVGQNLQDHFQARLIYDCPDPFSINPVFHSWSRRLRAAAAYALNRRGLLAMPAAPLGAFLYSRPHLQAPDLQWHVFPFSLDQDGRTPLWTPQFSVSVCLLTPHSRGSVQPRSPDPRAVPLIYPGYLNHTDDVETLVRGLKQAREFFSKPEMVEADVSEARASSDIVTDTDFAEHASRTGASAYHPVGTCAMGAQSDSVLDPNLRVRGIDGLWIADASAMPCLPRGDTNAPTIMIAEKAADLIQTQM